MALGARDWAVFTDAGISAAAPASLLLGPVLKDAVLKLCHEEATSFAPSIDASELERLQMEPWKLEFVIGRLAGTAGPLAFEVFKTLTLRVPNETHMLLALHVMRGGISLTLNFDEGIEIAYELLARERDIPADAPPEYHEALRAWRQIVHHTSSRVALASVATEREFDEWNGAGRPPALLKLHGSVRDRGAYVELREPVASSPHSNA